MLFSSVLMRVVFGSLAFLVLTASISAFASWYLNSGGISMNDSHHGSAAETLPTPAAAAASVVGEKEAAFHDTTSLAADPAQNEASISGRRARVQEHNTVYISMTTFNVGLLSAPKNLTFNLEQLVEKEMEILPVAVSDRNVDIAVLGFQELSRTPFYRLYDLFFGESWTESLTNSMASRGYFLFHSIRLNGVMMLVYARYHLLPYIRDVTELRVRWEPNFPYWGSKGTVGLSMRIYGQPVCFLCSHLPAHTVFNHSRIQNYEKVMQEGIFRLKSGRNLSILNHDAAFWMGDFNFRMDEVLTEDEIHALIDQKKYDLLMEHDQMRIAQREGQAFQEFQEPKVSFPPTYKFTLGPSSNYVRNITRAPGYCDRVVWHSNNSTSVTPMLYTSHPYIFSSDHKPVTGKFATTLDDFAIPPNVKISTRERYALKEDITFAFTVPDAVVETSWFDWIGLFEFGAKSIHSCRAWTYSKGNRASAYSVISSRHTWTPGKFFIAYVSRSTNAVIGISGMFEVGGDAATGGVSNVSGSAGDIQQSLATSMPTETTKTTTVNTKTKT